MIMVLDKLMKQLFKKTKQTKAMFPLTLFQWYFPSDFNQQLPTCVTVVVLQEKERYINKAENANSKLSELRNLTETMKDENEKLAASWKVLSEVGEICVQGLFFPYITGEISLI